MLLFSFDGSFELLLEDDTLNALLFLFFAPQPTRRAGYASAFPPPRSACLATA